MNAKPLTVTISESTLDGATVRWYTSPAALHPLIAVSRNGVYLRGWTTDFPPGLINLAQQVHADLTRNPATDLSYLTTPTTI